MPMFDLPLEQLRTYRPPRTEPADFDEFWRQTLEETRAYPLSPTFEAVDHGLALIDTFDVTFNGFGGKPIKGWFLLPRNRTSPLPCIVEFVGYGGGRGMLVESLAWSNFDFAHLIMDTRGQGSSWRMGDTPDYDAGGIYPQYPGFMTRGIHSPHAYYYRRVFADGVRAVETAMAHPAVDPRKVAVMGGSQGGGISIAVAGLMPNQLAALLPDVPFLCSYREAVQITEADPYCEITRYCRVHHDQVDNVFSTLDYFDGVNFAARGKAPALFSVGLMDEVCPPRTVFAAFNYYAGEKEMVVYPLNHHEGGGVHQTMARMRYLRALWG